MADTNYVSNFNLGGINLYSNPLFNSYDDQITHSDGNIIRSVNFDSVPLGGKTKRPGYVAFLDTADGSQVNSLFSWVQDSGTAIFLYRFSGNKLYYYDAGIGTQNTWLVCGNGTFNGTHIGQAVVNNTLTVGDGVGSTRYSTNGTSFTNTTAAPPSELFEQYQNRLFLASPGGGTILYSDTGDPTNFTVGGTNDSSSFIAPGGGNVNKLFKLGDRLHMSKNQGNIFRWDGFSLVDTATNLGPTSPYSYGSVEDAGFYLNRLGVYMIDINGPQIISNPISKYIYNEQNTQMPSANFGSAPGGVHRYDYYVSVGSTRDDLTDEPLNNAILKYNVIKNEWLTYQFNDNPTAYVSYKDASGSQTMQFGNSTGQVFTYCGTATTDNGVAIPTVIDMVFDFSSPFFEKEWRWFWGFFNPGCEAQIQIAHSNTFVKGTKKWIDLGDARSGVVQYHFPPGSRSRILYVRVKESSKNARSVFYGVSIGASLKDPG